MCEASGFSWLILWLATAPVQAAAPYDALKTAAIPVKAPAAAQLVAVTRAGQRLVAAGLHGVVIVSVDNGLHWSQASVPVDLTLTALYFVTDNEGWAVGHYGVILHTTDGGLHWAKVLDGRDVIKSLIATARQAPTVQPASADTQLKQKVATAFEAAGPSKPFLAIGKCDGGILAAGQQDMAMLSTDNGTSWTEWTSRIKNPNFTNIYDIISMGQVTYLLGEQGMVLKSASGCENFTPVTLPYQSTLFGGIVDGQNNFLVYGIGGAVAKSGDGGASWATAPMPNDSELVSGALLNSGQVLLGTVGGNLYLSDKAWLNFHQVMPTLPFEVAGVAVAPSGDVVTVGNRGVDVFSSTTIR